MIYIIYNPFSASLKCKLLFILFWKVLGDHSYECKRAVYLYGTYVGQAFQLIDDALDFEGFNWFEATFF